MTKKRAPAREKCVLLISPYLWNYSSNFKIVKSLTQLCKWATQKYYPKQHTAYVLLVRSPPKMPTFSEILFFGKNHAVLQVQHLQPRINGKSFFGLFWCTEGHFRCSLYSIWVWRQESNPQRSSINGKSCAPTGTEGYPEPKKAPSLRPISQQSPKKGHFYYIRTQVFAAY